MNHMKIRSATERDNEGIKEIAEQSFQASYSLSPLDIESIIEVEFGAENPGSRLDDDSRMVFVAEEDEELLGFVEARQNDDSGEIRWLHVAPTERGYGVGTELFEHVLADLRERAVENIQATVLSDNQEGGEFFQQFDFEAGGQTERKFDERTLHVETYQIHPAEQTNEDFTIPENEEITVDGSTRFLDAQAAIAGDEAQMLPVFADEAHEDHYGYYCTNCGTFTDSVDGQGRIICEDCGNEHRPEEWDESYL